MDTIKTCKKCRAKFKVIDQEKILLDKLHLKDPNYCPKCRKLTRDIFMQSPFMEDTTCCICHKAILNPYPLDNRRVMCEDCYHVQKWETTAQYDPDIPFIKQYLKLLSNYPIKGIEYEVNNERHGIKVRSNEVSFGKSSYDSFDLSKTLDVVDVQHAINITNCVSCTMVFRCENCLGCTNCSSTNNCYECHDCVEANNSYYCDNCKGIKNCFGSSGLRNTEFCIFNKKYSESDYKEHLKGLLALPKDKIEELVKQNVSKIPVPEQVSVGNVVDSKYGNQLSGSNSNYYVFNLRYSDNCGYIWYGESLKNCYDLSLTRREEDSYMNVDNSYGHDNLFNANCYECSNVILSKNLYKCSNCIGCVQIADKAYHILNNEFEQSEYEKLKDKILKEGFDDLFEINPRIPKSAGCICSNFVPNNIETVLGKELLGQNYSNTECYRCRAIRRYKKAINYSFLNTKCKSCQKEVITGNPLATERDVFCMTCYHKSLNNWLAE